MWIFLFVLALVPMVFYWSDSVTTVFPQLAGFFPAKGEQRLVVDADEKRVHLGPDGKPEESGRWYSSRSAKGYVAWSLSSDGAYRIAAGCRESAPASLQVTHISGKGLGDGLHLNFQYGKLALGAGAYGGTDLVGAVAQFSELYLQQSNGAVLAQFNVDGAESGGIARALESECAPAEAEAAD